MVGSLSSFERIPVDKSGNVLRIVEKFSSEKHLDEERRLFYVGMTRARKSLTLCYRRSELVGFRGNDRKRLHPSRFLQQLPDGIPACRYMQKTVKFE
jgi:superfamily I DNA/RNA helicase